MSAPPSGPLTCMAPPPVMVVTGESKGEPQPIHIVPYALCTQCPELFPLALCLSSLAPDFLAPGLVCDGH